MNHRHRAERPPARSRVLLALLALTLAVALGAVIDHRLDNPPGARDTPDAGRTHDPVHNSFAQLARESIPSLDISRGNDQLASDAQAVCDALAASPARQVYLTHDMPVSTPEDAARFLAASVVWRCPQYMGDLAGLIGQ